MKREITFLICAFYITTFGICAQNNDTAFQPSAALTTKDKVYGLSKFWKEVSYNFVYRYNRLDRPF